MKPKIISRITKDLRQPGKADVGLFIKLSALFAINLFNYTGVSLTLFVIADPCKEQITFIVLQSVHIILILDLHKLQNSDFLGILCFRDSDNCPYAFPPLLQIQILTNPHSDNRFNQYLIPQLNLLYTNLFPLIKIKTEHIPFSQTKMIQIS